MPLHQDPGQPGLPRFCSVCHDGRRLGCLVFASPIPLPFILLPVYSLICLHPAKQPPQASCCPQSASLSFHSNPDPWPAFPFLCAFCSGYCSYGIGPVLCQNSICCGHKSATWAELKETAHPCFMRLQLRHVTWGWKFGIQGGPPR